MTYREMTLPFLRQSSTMVLLHSEGPPAPLLTASLTGLSIRMGGSTTRNPKATARYGGHSLLSDAHDERTQYLVTVSLKGL